MRIVHSLVSLLLLAGATASARADEGASGAADAGAEARTVSDAFHSLQIDLSLASAGPVLFNDVPDTMLERTSVFQYGGGLALVFGDELRDSHRFGLGFDYATVARSDSRKLAFLTPHLIYRTGHPLDLQLDLGWAFGSGTKDYAKDYGGFYSGVMLGYSFRRSSDSKIGATLGLVGRVVLSQKGLQQSSAFVGAQIAFSYYKQGK